MKNWKEWKNMNFNKCCRCGCFYLNNSHVCPNWEQKDLSDISTLKNYFDENGLPNSLETLSIFTCISQINVNRLINENKELSNLYGKNLKL